MFHENQTEIEGLRRKNAKLKEEKKQTRIAKSKLEKKNEDKVRAELLAMDATKASQKTKLCACKLKNQFGPRDSPANLIVSKQKILQKGVSKSDSPAKRNRNEDSHPLTAGHLHHKSGPLTKGAGKKVPPKMPNRQGSYSDERHPI